jgi:hypothetical protein
MSGRSTEAKMKMMVLKKRLEDRRKPACKKKP